MDTKTRNIISDVHTEALSHGWVKDTWFDVLDLRLGEMADDVFGSAKKGMDLIKEQGVQERAANAFPWMRNRPWLEASSKRVVMNSLGEDFKPDTDHMIEGRSWLERILDEGETARPKDILHLARIAELCENPAGNRDRF